MTPSVSVFLDLRTMKSSGKHPLKLRVNVGKKDNRSWAIGFDFTEAEYERLVANQRKSPWKDTWIRIQAKMDRAEEVIKDLMPFFSFIDFKERFFSEKKSFKIEVEKTSILHIQNEVCKGYLKKGQFPMTVKIKDSVKSLLKFAKTDNIPMRAITPEFCRQYEEYMYNKSKKKTRNGAGINLRHVRILFNEGIGNNLIPREWYPFNDYTIPNERKVKEYLKENELIQFSEAKLFNTETQRRAHTAFLISFYCKRVNL